jgi:hypothetical protein
VVQTAPRVEGFSGTISEFPNNLLRHYRGKLSDSPWPTATQKIPFSSHPVARPTETCLLQGMINRL